MRVVIRGTPAALMFGLFFFIGGVAMVIAGICLLNSSSQFYSNAAVVKAVVTDVQETRESDGTSHTAYIDYEVNGVEYTHRPLSYYNSGISYGKEIEIYYDIDNPKQFHSKDADSTAVLILSVIGAFCAVIGVYVLIRLIIYKTKCRKLGEKKEEECIL